MGTGRPRALIHGVKIFLSDDMRRVLVEKFNEDKCGQYIEEPEIGHVIEDFLWRDPDLYKIAEKLGIDAEGWLRTFEFKKELKT